MEGICNIEKINGEEWVTFEYKFNNELSPEIISFLSNHKKVRFPWNTHFNKSIDNLPNSITDLTFGWRFNKPVDNLPNSLTHLEFEINSEFNQPVDHLPESLTHLKFGLKFNQPVDNLPNTLIHLEFRIYSEFNQPVNNLPQFLTHLAFGKNFNQPVTYQTESSQNEKSPTLLPNSLTTLRFGTKFNQPINKLPQSITNLKFYINSEFNQPVTYQTESSQNEKSPTLLPGSLNHLEFGKKFNQPINRLPISLKKLVVSINYSHPLPDNVEILKI